MQPIRTRYDQLEKLTLDNVTEDYIFTVINEEYFNKELNIKVDSEWESSNVCLTASTMGISMYYTVNGQTFTSLGLFIEYLQSIYDLKHMQKQIKNINEPISNILL